MTADPLVPGRLQCAAQNSWVGYRGFAAEVFAKITTRLFRRLYHFMYNIEITRQYLLVLSAICKEHGQMGFIYPIRSKEEALCLNEIPVIRENS
jgi:hypothetical protein